MTPAAFAQARRTAIRRCRNQDSDKIFTHALAEHYAVDSGKAFLPKDWTEENAKLRRSQDIRHFIFALDAKLAGEAVVDESAF